MEATTIGAEMLLKHCLVQGKILWRLQTLFPQWNLFTLFLFICFFLSTSSSFILHFSGKNELAKIAALVVDQSENRTCLSITREPHAWAPQSTLRVRFLRDRGCLSFNSYPVSSLITLQNNARIILA